MCIRDRLLAEIERAGGLEKWESAVGTPRTKAEALQKMWIEIKRQWLSRSGPPFPIALAVGKSDRLPVSYTHLDVYKRQASTTCASPTVFKDATIA